MCIYRQRRRRTGSCVLKSKALFYKLSSYVSCLYSNLHSGLFFNQKSSEKFKQQLFLAQLSNIIAIGIYVIFFMQIYFSIFLWMAQIWTRIVHYVLYVPDAGLNCLRSKLSINVGVVSCYFEHTYNRRASKNGQYQQNIRGL